MKLSDILRIRSAPFIMYLFLVASPVFILGFAGYLGVIVPLKGKLLAEQTRSLGTGIDATIGERANCLAVAVGEDELGDFLEEGRLQEIVRSIQTRFADFISLELIDGSGTILAMAGEMGISPEGGLENETVKQLAGRFPRAVKRAWTVHDDPAGEYFSVTWVRREGGAEPFFVRARFSRKPIRDLLEAVSKEIEGVAGFVQVADAGAGNWYDAAESGSGFPSGIGPTTSSPVAVSGKWFSAPIRTEMRLSVPGWAVTLEGNPKGILSTWQIAWTGALSLLALLLVTSTILRPFWRLSPEAPHEGYRTAASSKPADSAQEPSVPSGESLAESDDHFVTAPHSPAEHPLEGPPAHTHDDFITRSQPDDQRPVCGDYSASEESRDVSGDLFGASRVPSDAAVDDDFLGWTPSALPGKSDDLVEDYGRGFSEPDSRSEATWMEPGGSLEEPAGTWDSEQVTPAGANEEPSDEFASWDSDRPTGEANASPHDADEEEFLVISWEEPAGEDQPDSSSGPPHTTLS